MTGLYLRLSINDGCNLRCVYCRPERDFKLSPGRPALERPELLDLVGLIHAQASLRKVRLTGGEPLLRPDTPELVADLRSLLPDTELCLTTNGTLLRRRAGALRAAGLDRINVSLDSAEDDSYAALTRGGNLSRVVAGLEAARLAGFDQIKLNAVLLRSLGDEQPVRLARLAAGLVAEIRFIELMPISVAAGMHHREFLAASEAAAALRRVFGELRPLPHSATAERFALDVDGRPLTVGFIAPVSHPFCGQCDRLRLDCRGKLFACLRHPDWLDLGTPLRRGDRAEVCSRVQRVLEAKCAPESVWPGRQMSAIGG